MIDVVRSPLSTEQQATLESGGISDALKKQLWEEFLRKCYLCERPVEQGSYEIEHIYPKNNNAWPEYRTRWRNLAIAHDKCNKRRILKESRVPWLVPGGWEQEAGVSERLIQRLDDTLRPVFEAKNKEDEAAKNTAKEQDHLFNDNHASAVDLLCALRVHLAAVYKIEHQLREAEEAGDQENKEKYRLQLRRFLSNAAPFTALMRSEFYRYKELFDTLQDHTP